MIPQILLKLILPKAVDHIAKIFKLNKVLDYVENDNELDHEVKNMGKRIDMLEKIAHPEKNFVVCEKCKGKVEECGEESLE